MHDTFNILIVGVGGQGVILASELLTEAAMQAGHDAKKSEVHGMSQRGGVVTSHVRFGPKVYSPLIPYKSALVVLAFEAAEGLRWANQVAPGGLLVVNNQKIVPTIAFSSEYDYPEDPIAQASGIADRVMAIDGLGIAHRIGNPKLMNTVLIGAISGELPIEYRTWETVIRRRVPRGTEKLNLTAFKEGLKIVKVEAKT